MADQLDQNRWRALWDLLAPERKTRIVDVGANPINIAPYDGLLSAGLLEVWAFEPQPDAYAQLMNAPRANQKVLPYAVGRGGSETLYVCRNSGFASLLHPSADFLAYMNRWHQDMEVVEQVDVDTRQLDAMDEIPDFDLLKIDVQGGELSVFEHGRTKLSSAIAVITEIAAIPLYEDQPLLDEQMRELRAQGFDLHKLLHVKTAKTGRKSEFGFSQRLRRRFHTNQFIDGDAIFVRDLLSLDTLTTEQLRHLAILGDAVIGSFDLTVQALTILAERGAVNVDAVNAYIDQLPFVIPATRVTPTRELV